MIKDSIKKIDKLVSEKIKVIITIKSKTEKNNLRLALNIFTNNLVNCGVNFLFDKNSEKLVFFSESIDQKCILILLVENK